MWSQKDVVFFKVEIQVCAVEGNKVKAKTHLGRNKISKSVFKYARNISRTKILEMAFNGYIAGL